jgi:hypothetical protein
MFVHSLTLIQEKMTMEQDTTNVENVTRKESYVTRRKMLQVTAVGGLVAVTGLQIAYRRSGNKKNPLTEITIEGPFKEYGYFRPEDLGREDIKKLESDFKLEALVLKARKRGDLVMISFTFSGEQNPNRKMKIFLSVRDAEGNVIGGAENIFDDPRIRDGSEIILGLPIEYIPIASLTAMTEDKMRISMISKIDICVAVLM